MRVLFLVAYATLGALVLAGVVGSLMELWRRWR